jgi:seryl-tRNA synthetase
MLDFRAVGEDLEGYRRRLSRRPKFDAALLDRVRDMYAERQTSIRETQQLQEQRNAHEKRMQQIMRTATAEEKTAAREEGRNLGERVKELEQKTKQIEEQLEALMLDIPNVPHDSVPDGEDETHNKVVRVWGEKPSFDFEPLDHVAIGVEKLALLDFERASKIAGSRFVVQYDEAARMERALTSFMLDLHTREHGYREVRCRTC